MAPNTTKQWIVGGEDGFESLEFQESVPLPPIGENDVLVKLHAASLNYRDLLIPKGLYSLAHKKGVVQGSDGAGVVEAVGGRVTRFKPGDKVVTLLLQGHIAGTIHPTMAENTLGGVVDGTFRQYGVFNEQGLSKMPANLSFLEASTLSCAALTAWNALYGVAGTALMPGDWVLTQGTGVVSLSAVKFAKAAGAKVIATTSSSEKAEFLKKLGADHVINYKTDPNWGQTAKDLTPDKLGVNHIIEVGGQSTWSQSLSAIKIDGVITIIGFVGGIEGDHPSFIECWRHACTVRGIWVGSRLQFEQMSRAIEANDIHPVMDDKIFSLDQLKEAYQYMWDQNNFGKIGITIE